MDHVNHVEKALRGWDGSQAWQMSFKSMKICRLTFVINYMIAIFCFLPDSLLTRPRLFSDTETRVRKHSLI